MLELRQVRSLQTQFPSPENLEVFSFWEVGGLDQPVYLFGKWQAPRRSPEFRDKPRYFTSDDWINWLQFVRDFTGAVEGRNVRVDPRPLVWVNLLSRSFHALVDTGVVVNLKGDEVAEHLRQRGVEPRGANVVLKMVEGSTSKPAICTLCLEKGSMSTTCGRLLMFWIWITIWYWGYLYRYNTISESGDWILE